jgi:hypothetical protein
MAATIAPFPHTYTVALEDRQLRAPPRAPIAAGPPPQFGGSADVWSPEELLVAAALECLWTTFEAYASREQLAVARWSGRGTAVLDRGPGTVRRLRPAGGVEPDGMSFDPEISADGRYVAFQTFATTWVAGATNGDPDVIVYDTTTDTIQRTTIGCMNTHAATAGMIAQQPLALHGNQTSHALQRTQGRRERIGEVGRVPPHEARVHDRPCDRVCACLSWKDHQRRKYMRCTKIIN